LFPPLRVRGPRFATIGLSPVSGTERPIAREKQIFCQDLLTDPFGEEMSKVKIRPFRLALVRLNRRRNLLDRALATDIARQRTGVRSGLTFCVSIEKSRNSRIAEGEK